MPYSTASPLVNITDEDINNAMRVALASSGGGLSVKAPKLTLTHAPEGGVYDPTQIRTNEKYFKALDPEGTTQAEMLVRFRPDSTARIEDILMPELPREQGRGALGISTLRDLLAQFRAQHPEVTGLSGHRVSGAVNSGKYDISREAAGRQANIPLKPAPVSQYALPKSKGS